MLTPALTPQQPGELVLPTLPQVATTGTVPGDTSARTRGSGARSIGRDEVVSRVLDVCARPGTPVVLVTGPAGIGRSAVLAQVREKLTELEVATADAHISRADLAPPNLVAVIADQLGLPPSRDDSSSRLLAALAGRRARLVVFLDDVHRLGPASLAALTSSINALAGTQVTFVCAARTPGTDVDALRTSGPVHVERLRPLPVPAVAQVLTDLLRAEPAPGLAASIRNAGRGIPAVVQAAVEGYQRSGCLRVVDRQAHLVGNRAPELPATHPLFVDLYRSESPTWPVIKALAVLHPLRGAVPALIAEAVGIDEEAVLDALHELRAAGVVLPGRPAGSWRFRAPMLATLLTACLGPFERRRSSQLAVNAIRDGNAFCPDPDYLPERLVDAGRPIDQEHTAADLLAASARPEAGELADRWVWTATRLLADSAQRAAALHRHAVTCAVHQRFGPATQAADAALRGLSHQLTPDSSQELQIIYAIGLASSGNAAALHELAQDGWRSMPGSEANRIVTRAAALCLLNRWKEAHDLLTTNSTRYDDAAAHFGQIIGQAAGAFVNGGPIPETQQAGTIAAVLIRTLSIAGWLDCPEREVAIGASFSGRWDDALDLARSDLAAASAHGHGPERTATFREMATILTARGQLNRARTVLEDARSHHLLLPHLLSVPEAELERTLGATARAKELVEEGLALAAENGTVAGTDELWLLLAESESQAGNPDAAQQCAARLDEIAAQLGTTGARRNQLLARLLVQPDPGAATEVIELAEARNRPFELASTLAAVAESGAGHQRLLHTAYEMFGELDALIPRGRVRGQMRARNMTVPGRSATVAENERLLAALITEGLTNSQLATVLGTSEKSVEGRLTRLFNRTGYRSRTELAAAMLSGSANLAG
ncbi:AAA family ATPase [Saccharopolyspora sp. NPDC002376]